MCSGNNSDGDSKEILKEIAENFKEALNLKFWFCFAFLVWNWLQKYTVDSLYISNLQGTDRICSR